MLPEIATTIVPAYLDGLAAEGITGIGRRGARRVRHRGLLRSGFDCFLYDLIGREDAGDRHTFDERVLCASSPGSTTTPSPPRRGSYG